MALEKWFSTTGVLQNLMGSTGGQRKHKKITAEIVEKHCSNE